MPLIYVDHGSKPALEHELREIWRAIDGITHEAREEALDPQIVVPSPDDCLSVIAAEVFRRRIQQAFGVSGIPPTTINAIARWADVLGMQIKNSRITIDDDGNMQFLGASSGLADDTLRFLDEDIRIGAFAAGQLRVVCNISTAFEASLHTFYNKPLVPFGGQANFIFRIQNVSNSAVGYWLMKNCTYADPVAILELVNGGGTPSSAMHIDLITPGTPIAGELRHNGVPIATINGSMSHVANQIFGRHHHRLIPRLKAGANITLVERCDEVEIAASASGTPGDSDQTVLPTSLFAPRQQHRLIPRLKAGTNVTLTERADEVEIAASGTGTPGDSDQNVLPGRVYRERSPELNWLPFLAYDDYGGVYRGAPKLRVLSADNASGLMLDTAGTDVDLRFRVNDMPLVDPDPDADTAPFYQQSSGIHKRARLREFGTSILSNQIFGA